MNMSVTFFIQQQLKRLEQNCSSAASRVQQSTTMRDVKFAAQVLTPSMLHGQPQVRTALRQVHLHASRRMEKLLDEQLARLAALSEPAEVKAMRGAFTMNEWIHLRGPYGTIYSRAERDSMRILHTKTQFATSCSDAGTSHRHAPDAADDERPVSHQDSPSP